MRLLLAVFFISGFSNYSSAQTNCAHTNTRFNCVRYLDNYDGDTVTFKIPNIHPLFGDHISVRVKGIDTAEIRTKNACEKEAGRTAQRLVASLLKNSKRIDLLNVARDKYFRILADVEFDGRNLKDVLIKNNLAYLYDGGTKRKMNWCLRDRVPATKHSP